MNGDDMTQQIMSAWDEIQAEEEPPAEESEGEESEGEEQEKEPEVAAEEEESEAEAEEEESAEEEQGEGEEEEGEEQEEQEQSPEIAAFLAKYDGDVDQALRAAAELQRVIGRQGSEKAALAQRVQQLEQELEQTQAFQPSVGMLSPEQEAWVEEAVGSGNPAPYVQRATQEGEFELARAVASEWVRERPADGLRALQYIEQAEQRQNTPEPQPVDTGVLLGVLAENFPEMSSYEAQMVSVLGQLGPGHPLVHDARSGDVNTAARGIIGIYEIARASSASVRSAKDGLRRKHRQEADSARESALVSSASSSPSASETPRRTRQLMPGLTFEDFDAEFAR